MDFTFDTHTKLLESLLRQGFSFCTLNSYVSAAQAAAEKNIILRHDVEEKYEHALRFASIQHTKGIQGSYYFRILPKPRNEAIIREIASLGHEVGYHYDDLSECNGDYPRALERFRKNLAYLRQFAPVTTITMEGAPLSKYDNRDLWKQPLTPKLLESLNLKSSNQPRTNQQINKSSHQLLSSQTRQANQRINESTNQQRTNQQINKEQINKEQINKKQTQYSHFGILAEPYFDLDFNQILYLTDTGRCWDGHLYNVRDKATKENPVTNPDFLKLRFHSTQDIIKAVNEERFPNQAMLNFHPQRWTNRPVPWVKELVWQNIKNQGKRMLLAVRK